MSQPLALTRTDGEGALLSVLKGLEIQKTPILDDSVYKVSGTAISFDANLTVAVTGSIAYVSSTAAGGGGGLSALPIQDNGVFVVSGTAISFDKDLIVTASGTVAHVEVPAGTFASGSHTHPIGSTAIQIFEDGVFKVTGTAINFTDGFEIVASGTVAHIQVPGYDEARYLGVYNYYEPGGAANYRIGSVKSPNLRDWEKVTEPILGLGGGGSFDDVHLRCPHSRNKWDLLRNL